MKKKTGIVLIILTNILLFFVELKFQKYFSIDRFLILSFTVDFCFFHLIFDIKKMYSFIYKKRYIIGLIILVFITIRGLHGSSIYAWDVIIQPNHKTKGSGVLIGILRLIRGDEYFVTTPHIISQIHTHFSNISNLLMGKNSLVTLFPMLPTYNISVICNIFNLPYLVLPFENAFALSWYSKLFVIFFANFEMLMLITKKNKLYSLMGATMIACSPVCSWWSIIPILAWGPLAILILNLFLNENSKILKLCYTIFFSLIGINYIMLLYPAWQVPFGYVFLCLAIWILYENRTKLNIKQLFYLVLSILLMLAVIYCVISESYEILILLNSTVYPGERFIVGGYGYEKLFNYLVNIFFPCIPFDNPCEYSDFISFFPIPIILTIKNAYVNIKNKKATNDILYILLAIATIILLIWNFIKIPSIFAKISLLSFSTPERSNIVIGYICILFLVRTMSLYEKDNITKKTKFFSLFVSILTVTLGMLLINRSFGNFVKLYIIIIILLVFTSIMYLILINSKKANKYLAVILILVSLFAGGTINPISKGLDVITEKPFAKEVRKIVNINPKSKWLVIDSNYAIPNYLIANGASTINSTNYYPNMDLWKKLDKNGKYSEIYNRYSHILVSLTLDETSFKLIQNDCIKLILNVNDLNKIKVDYIVTEKLIEEKFIYLFELVYNEDGIFIYKIKK